jgi:2-keto-myo-inositol isomerase
MRLGFNGATTMTSSLETDIRIAGQAGFYALEITASKLHRFLINHSIDDAYKLIGDARLRPYTINSIERINFRDAEGRAEIMMQTQLLSQYARSLACQWIIAVPGRAPDGLQWKAARGNTVAALQEMGGIAESYGVGIAFEFLGFPWSSVRTAAQAWEVVQETDRTNVGMVVDTCHFYAGGSTSDSIGALDSSKVAILHINDVEPLPRDTITDANRLFPGDGVIPLRQIIGDFRKIGYDDVASVEIFRPEYWQRDPLSVAEEAKVKSLQVLEY